MIKKLKYIVIMLFCFGDVLYCQADTHLTFIHTNDLHAHLLPSNQSGQDCQSGLDCLGGFARLKIFLDLERKKNPDLFYFDSGDRFSGTVFYTLHKEKPFISLFNLLKPDAMTLGNHEFDDENTVLKSFINKVNVPFVVTNAHFPNDADLQKKIVPSKTFMKNGVKVGVLGALPLEVKTSSMHTENIELVPLTKSLKMQIDQLKKSGVDVIVLLSHLGIDAEKTLAQELPELDIIFGGHSHTLLSNTLSESDGPYPLVVQHFDKTQTLIVSAGSLGQYVGKLDVIFNEKGEVKTFSGDTVGLSEEITEDKQVSDLISSELKNIQTELNQKIQTNPSPILMTEDKNYCVEQCPIGQTLTDIVLSQVDGAEVVLINSGSIRSGLEQGDILFQNLIQILPFDSTLVLTEMTGRKLKNYIASGLRKYQSDKRVNALLQISGGTYTFNPKTRQVDSFKIQEKNYEPDRKYRVVLPLFLTQGGDEFEPLSSYQILPKTMLDYLQDYLKKAPYYFHKKFSVQKSV